MTSLQDHEIAEWFAASKPHPHENVCGDGYLVKNTERGVLFCVVDGLGHGKEAYAATERALHTVTDHADDDLAFIMESCNTALKQTRGAVVSLVLFDHLQSQISWVGVGNVEGVLLRPSEKREWLPLRSGIVGCRMPRLTVTSLPLTAGDLLVMYSDGVHNRAVENLQFYNSAQEIASGIMSDHLRHTDDAIVLVARYHGTQLREDCR